MRNVKLIAALVVSAVMMSIGAATPAADAGFFKVPIWKTYFPPYEDTGTIIEIGTLERGAGGETCLVFLGDSDGGLYFFNGVDSFAPGTRLHVAGNTCTICLSTLTCGMPASPILNAVATEL